MTLIKSTNGMGKPHNPNRMYLLLSSDEINPSWVQFESENQPLTVINKSGNIVMVDGEFECEKVWQYRLIDRKEFKTLPHLSMGTYNGIFENFKGFCK